MAIKYTTYSNDNLRKLEIAYTESTPTGQVVESEDSFFAVMKAVTTERYQYYGMTEAAAETCVSEINALSTASVKYSARGSRIADSNMWNVDVTKTTTLFDTQEILTEEEE